MQQAVYPVKVKAFPNWDHEKQGDEPNRVGRPSQYGGVTVGQSPKHQGLISCPNDDPARQGPEHIVVNLAAKREFLTVLHQRAVVIFQILALFGELIKYRCKPPATVDIKIRLRSSISPTRPNARVSVCSSGG